MDLWELEAREQVRDTVLRYNHFGDVGRADDLAGLFTDDGVLDITGGPRIEGRAAIAAFIGGVVEGGDGAPTDRGSLPDYVRHNVTSLLIDRVSPDEAEVRAYFFVVTQIGPDHWGRYRDVLVPDGDRWRFRRRTVRTDGYAPGSLFR